ncbi:hypothetical protein MYX76_04100 [Desulfobacterota bacterium AH_259_B03_O07]|nr:hypothetical protein [Desulfobacterota bacterium AH_259_B03_O07]
MYHNVFTAPQTPSFSAANETLGVPNVGTAMLNTPRTAIVRNTAFVLNKCNNLNLLVETHSYSSKEESKKFLRVSSFGVLDIIFSW